MTDWFRSWHGAPTDPKWLGIAKRAGVAPGIAVAVAWALMDRASQAADRGSIEGYDADGLACFFGCEPEQVDAIVAAMEAKGVVEDGRLTSWKKRQPKREDDSAERVREHRKRKQAQTERNVTHRNAPETDTEKIEKGAPDGAPKKRATRLPENWVIPDDWLQEAISEGLSEQRARSEAERMKNWSLGADKGAKRDWRATWRNWFRDKLEKPPPRGQPPPQQRTVSDVLGEIANGTYNPQGQNDEPDYATIETGFQRRN